MPSETAAAGLVVDDLRIAFRCGALPVVHGVSFSIAPGEALGLVGESGSGKSLTARAVLGLLPAGASVSGRIALDGVSLLDLPEAERAAMRGARIAMIFQDPMSSLNPVLRVGDAVAQVIRSHRGRSHRGRSHRNLGAREARTAAIAMLERVGITDAAIRGRAFPHEFSGGMRQRIMIAMALAASPSLLLADEPTTALDVVVQAGILRLLDRLRRSHRMALLFVSHDLAVVAQTCDRIAVMYAGQIVEEGPAQRILTRPRMPYTIGLLSSIPRRARAAAAGGARQARLASIPGAPPAAGSTGIGCSFAPRCPLAADICVKGPIPLLDLGDGQRARCVRLAETAS